MWRAGTDVARGPPSISMGCSGAQAAAAYERETDRERERERETDRQTETERSERLRN